MPRLGRLASLAALALTLVAGRDDLGRLLPGYIADLIVVPALVAEDDSDPAALAAIRPTTTLIDGAVVYSVDSI